MGPYYKDDIYISGAKIENQQFGVANSSELVWFGIMGLGHGRGVGSIDYPLIVESLASQGLTNTRFFSMNLGQQVSSSAVITGEMAFGGVDTNSYSGMLEKVPTDPSDPHYKVTLNSLAHRAPGAESATVLTDSSLPLPLIIDSGTTLSLLPEPLVNKLAAQFPGAKSDGSGGYRVSCSYQNQSGTVDFEFLGAKGPVTINVGYSDFIWNSGGECFLGAWYSDDIGAFILGDSFMRGAYVAFDQTNNALFMSNRLSCGDGQSNLVAVPVGSDAAASIKGSCTPVVSPSSSPPKTGLVSSTTSLTSTHSNSTTMSIASTLAPSVNPVGPMNTITVSTFVTQTNSQSLSSSTTKESPSHSTSSGSLYPTSEIPKTPQGPADSAEANPTDPPRVDAQHDAGSLTTTITATITRAVVYTVTACPATVRDCPLRGKVTTKLETILTTYCPGSSNAKIPAATAAGEDTLVAEHTTPVVTPAVITPNSHFVEEITTHTSSSIAAGYSSVMSISAEHGQGHVDEHKPGQSQDQDREKAHAPGQGEARKKEQIVVITTAFPTSTVYAIKTCSSPGSGDGDSDSSACTVGKTTTLAFTTTVVKTLHVVPVPTSSAVLPSGGHAAPGGSRNATGGASAVVVSAAPGAPVGALIVVLVIVLGAVVVGL
ncbi:aspartic peptidase domain-containing protein [Astrocystis sublimbata]|nr:aspartic peptidase domain-containing protein [Astrocystis sublimbata]